MGKRKKGEIINGWIVLDKADDVTSTQMVGAVRRLFNARKAGHAGTLDPLATGILPIALGEATKTIPYLQDSLKTYRFTVTWGEQRNTDDAEGEIIETSDVRPSKEEIEAILPEFTGFIKQTPPQFSALKIQGERAYDLARDGEKLDLPEREVEIDDLRLIEHEQDTTKFECDCGTGTYIRALARDFGLKLGCFGYISALRRTAVGPFTEKGSFLLDNLQKMADSAALDEALLPVDAALDDIPVLALTADEASKLAHGQTVAFLSRQDVGRLDEAGIVPGDGIVTALARTTAKPIALVEIAGAELRPVRVLNL